LNFSLLLAGVSDKPTDHKSRPSEW